MSDFERPPFFPMMVNLHGKRVIVVGGGNIASRRADTLLRCGAEVVAVSPEFCDEFPKNTYRVTREFLPKDIACDVSLVVAATNNRETNRLIHDTAKALHIPVNVADSQEECDFFFPSLINCGNVSVSVCTAGLSPELTHLLSDRLRKVWASWVEREMKECITAKGLNNASSISLTDKIFLSGSTVQNNHKIR